MKKILSVILYTIFFGFAAVLFVSCIILIVKTANRNVKQYNDLEAVMIDDREGTDNGNYAVIGAEVSSQSPKGYRDIQLKYGYQALDTANKQDLYDRIEKNIYSVSEDMDDNGHYRLARLKIIGEKMSEFDIREVMNAYLYDNPQVFWLENLFGYAYAGEDTIVEFYSELSAEECEDCIALFNKKVDEIVAAVDSGLSEYEREKIVHDKVLDGCVYKKGVESSKDGWQYFSAYGALVTGEAVCEGYAKSMQIILSKVGIPCLTIRGEADGILHMWNVVELNDEWYHLDPTWDDNDKDGKIIYEYFNLSTENISQSHKINQDIMNGLLFAENREKIGTIRYNFFVPMCVSMNMNYYMQEGVQIEKFDTETDQKVINAFVKRVRDGENYFPLRFGTEMSYREYIDKLFYEAPYKYYYYVDHANEILDKQNRISKDSISVLTNENNLTLRIRIRTGESA